MGPCRNLSIAYWLSETMFPRRLRSHATGNDVERTAQRLVERLGKWLGQKVASANMLDFSKHSLFYI